MKNFLTSVSEGLRRVRKVWIITAVVVLGIIVGAVGFGSGTIQKAIAARQNKNDLAATVNVGALATATELPVSGIETTPTAVPEIAAPTTVPGDTQTVAANDLDALTVQMQTMLDSLNGTMQQLDQKGANLPPSTTSTSVDLQPLLTELQAIEQELGPLMVRVQADLQGNPSPEELASVRAQVEQIQVRMANLMNQIQAARNGTAPVAAATLESMPGMTNSTPSMDNMMQTMDDMMTTMDNMAMNGSMSSSDSSMDQMMQMMDDMMSTMDDMMGMSGMSDPMTGTSTTNSAMMDDMMMMMDDMMDKMDKMMEMDMGMPDM